MVTANICRSIMELAQKNINFGTVFKHTKHPQKTLVINNLSEVPLVYRVKKSGSIASLDLIISKADRMGIIRPYRRKELHFLFKPTITGTTTSPPLVPCHGRELTEKNSFSFAQVRSTRSW